MKRPLFAACAAAGVALVFWLSTRNTPDPVLVTSSPPPGPTLELTEAQEAIAKEFGRNFADAVAERQLKEIEGAFDYEAVLDRALEGVRMEAKQLREFRASLVKGIRKRPGGLLAAVAGHGYRFLGIRELEGEPQLLFRFIPSEGGVDFHSYRFRIDADGRVGLTDFYPFMTGGGISQSLRRMALPLAEKLHEGAAKGLFDEKDSLVEKHASAVTKLAESNAAGDHDEALAIYEALPEILRRDRYFQGIVLPLYAASERDAAYLELIENMAEDHHADPSIPLVMIDYHLRKQEYAKAMEKIGKIEETVGEDAYLDVQRAIVHLKEERAAAAMGLLRSVVAAEGTLESAWWTMLQAALGTGEHVMVASALHRLQTGFGHQFPIDAMKEDATYEDFFASPAGRSYLKVIESEG